MSSQQTRNIQSGKSSKWKKLQHNDKSTTRLGNGSSLDVGFEGMWVTCVRGSEKRAMAEFIALCNRYIYDMWPLKPIDETPNPYPQRMSSHGPHFHTKDDECDIETSIRREIESMKAVGCRGDTFSRSDRLIPIYSAMECVFFVRTRPPIVPLDLTMRICTNCYTSSDDLLNKACRYINRITPISTMDKATINGIARLSRSVLAPYFRLTADVVCDKLIHRYNSNEETETMDQVDVNSQPQQLGYIRNNHNLFEPPCTYAIRTTIRHHNDFTSTVVIKQVADLIDNSHKVDLTTPDKVILIEIYQMLCGMAVVDGKKYEALKRFNMAEISNANIP